ncbi:MAG TPA: ATP synthase F1 subunit gamma [Candidatus Binatia bacterium]|jgi:F-type H+-transporting ATPase subunit gamma|nr:ATP synthase F1 subunit gamma [Candidatus Binatia bacterium]
MANVLDLRRRIRSVKNTRQITKAMKMVSAAKLRRAQERALQSRPFAQMLTNVLQSVVSRAELYNPETGLLQHPLLRETRPEKTVLIIIITGDRGLAGAFNTNVLKAPLRFTEYLADKNIDVVAIGRKGRDFLRRRFPVANPETEERAGRVQIVGEYVNILGNVEFETVEEIAEKIIKQYEREVVDGVYLVFNEFKSVIAQRVIVQRILPVQEIGRREVTQVEELSVEARERMGEAAKSAGISLQTPEESEIDREAVSFATAPVDYIYEQPPAELLNAILPRYVAIQIYASLLESVAAEHAARMTAMDSATNNANEVIDSLTLNLNRVRQAAITKEIIEIVSGAAAL